MDNLFENIFFSANVAPSGVRYLRASARIGHEITKNKFQ
jgi:hypothetical protein